MINRDWEDFGEDIRRTVQNAIDAQDFAKLNQTITNTINTAAESITQGIKNAGESKNYRPRSRAGSEAASFAQERARESQRKSPVSLYKGTTPARVGSILLTVSGAAVGGLFALLSLLFLLGTFVSGYFGAPTAVATAIFLMLGAGGFLMCGLGAGMLSRIKRFRAYIQIIGSREYCNIRELAQRTQRKERYVVKDLEQMLRKGWFLQGHLDEQKTCLIVSHEMYEQYRKLQEDKKQREQEEIALKMQRQKMESKTALPPRVQKVVDEGDVYIRKIRACNDAIPGQEISAKISRMETIVDRIFDRVEQNPESVDDIRKLMEYYLPTTVKLLEAYKELDAQPIDGVNIRSSKAEIEATLDTLNVAFEKLLDSLFLDTAWDVSSDISVLHTMLAQEGLTKDGINR